MRRFWLKVRVVAGDACEAAWRVLGWPRRGNARRTGCRALRLHGKKARGDGLL